MDKLRLRGGARSFVVGSLILFALWASPIESSQVRSLGLEEMTDRAAIVFSGRCIGIRHERDAALGIEVTRARFRVERAIKGRPGSTIEIKLLGGESRLAGVPTFRIGEEVVLFLYGTSDLGFTSPVGLGQGKFSVVTDKQGRKLAFNEFGNANLEPRFKSAVPGDGGGVDPVRLLDLVGQHVSRKKTDARP